MYLLYGVAMTLTWSFELYALNDKTLAISRFDKLWDQLAQEILNFLRIAPEQRKYSQAWACLRGCHAFLISTT